MAEKMDRHSIRYMLEHKLLPRYFYSDTESFLKMLLLDKKVLFRIISDIFRGESVENPYKEEDFDTYSFKVSDEVRGICINMPEPEEEPLCYKIYMIFNMAFDKLWYFTIEKGNEIGDEYPFVCAWTAEGGHLNLGNCTFEKSNDLIRCLDIYMEREYDLVRDTEAELEEFNAEEKVRKKKYDDFMDMCREKYPEFFKEVKFSDRQERTQYVLLYLYHRSKVEGSKRFVCKKEEIVEYYWKNVSGDGISNNLATLEKNGYIDRKIATDEKGMTIGTEYYLRM